MESRNTAVLRNARPARSALAVSGLDVSNVALGFGAVWFMGAAHRCRNSLRRWVGNHTLSVFDLSRCESDCWFSGSRLLGPNVVSIRPRDLLCHG
jgi:hypothetical protein